MAGGGLLVVTSTWGLNHSVSMTTPIQPWDIAETTLAKFGAKRRGGGKELSGKSIQMLVILAELYY